MNKLEIIKKGITDLDVDCIVNAANTALQAGGGVCGAIFDAAGLSQLQKACDAVGGCEVGSAVITPGFRLKAKYVIHAVGPRWRGGKSGEAKLLSGCYQNSLQLAVENQCHSIAFPLISAGIFGYPKKEAWEVALQTAQSFLQKHPDASLHVIFSVLDQEMLVMHQFTGRRIDALLAAMRKAGVPKIALKAIVTESNCDWKFCELYEELKKEHAAMSGS